MNKTLKKIGKVLLYIVGVLLIVLLIITAFLWIKSPGKAQPITDAQGQVIPGSISTIEKVMLGGVEQYLIIRGADSTKPVMLFLHGGPGSPEYPFIRTTNPDLEKDFVMVYWEQRGAGKSYSKDLDVKSMTLAQMISDTRELSQILAARFGQEKIYLMGTHGVRFLEFLPLTSTLSCFMHILELVRFATSTGERWSLLNGLRSRLI